MSRQSKIEEAIDLLLTSREDQLTEWEIGFLHDIYEYDHLTDKQQETLDKIWKRVMNA